MSGLGLTSHDRSGCEAPQTQSLSSRVARSIAGKHAALGDAPNEIEDLWQWIEEQDIDSSLTTEAFGDVLRIPVISHPENETPSAEFIARIPIQFSRQYHLLGLAGDERTMRLVVGDLRYWFQIDVVARFLDRPIEVVLAPRERVSAAINAAYQQLRGQTQKILDTFDEQDILSSIHSLSSRQDLLDVSDRAPVIKLVNMILFDAVSSMASDIHLQPYEESLVVRMRIDGILFDAFQVPKPLQDEIVSRIKVIGQMDIAEKRLPQDGRSTVQVGDRVVDLRIASMPTSHGERAVIRILDKSARLYQLSELGMDPQNLALFRRLIAVEHGLILVTGPTGSGKSTTLYSALKEINSKDRNVVTLEDPIEYELEGISQTQINSKKGMTFASGLRSVLRQDPDIIMVGEIRDRETAVMAIQSALTGHLVFSTLHTNDAASAVTRLLDLGIEPYLVSSSVITVLAQRLVRRICEACRTERNLSPEEAELIEDDPPSGITRRVAEGAGCSECRQTGYRGRVGIFELLPVDGPIREAIGERADATVINRLARRSGMKTLQQDGLTRAFEGQTTIEEVVRVTMRTCSEAT